MQRKEAAPSIYYYECPNCHYDIGKPAKEDSNEKEEKETSSKESGSQE